MTDTERKALYDDAVALFDQENYQDAMNAFKNIRGYLDADSYIQKCGSALLLQRQKKTTKTLSNNNVIEGRVLKLKQFEEEEPKPKSESKKKKQTVLSGLSKLFKSKDEKPVKEEKKEKKVARKIPEKEVAVSFPDNDLKSPIGGLPARKNSTPYVKPSLELLESETSGNPDAGETEINGMAESIISSLKQYGVSVSLLEIVKGPSVILFEFELGSGTPISKLTSKEEEISYALGGKKIRILAPVPGKKAIGIEVANPDRRTVYFKDALNSLNNDKKFTSGALPMIVGTKITGDICYTDVAGMPHMIIAGTTGSGKSIFINTFISTLLFLKSPEDVRVLLIDPKRVELSVYNGIPHLLAPVIVDVEKTLPALEWLNSEMERRYKMLMAAKARNIEDYNDLSSESKTPKLPYILTIIDEYADVVAMCGKSIELSINRLAAKARAVGIHLILATQRPSADVVTGTLKSNLPGRIAFAVSSAVNSRIILDESGAELLTGKGDLLFKDWSEPVLTRAQAPFITGKEVGRIVEFASQNNDRPQLIVL